MTGFSQSQLQSYCVTYTDPQTNMPVVTKTIKLYSNLETLITSGVKKCGCGVKKGVVVV
jgi:hypothetical protein